jgi:hypothetical protein
MANTGAIITGVAFTVTLFTAGEAPAAQDAQKVLVLHVDNYARIPPSTLARAEAEAGRVYAAAGVGTTWVHGDDEANARDAGGLHVRVLLLCADMTRRKADTENIGGAVLGRAAHGSSRAYIFTPRVIDAAMRSGKLFEIVLGRVIAHEVGHLLLPAGSHSAAGIMRANVNLARSELVTFTAPQATQIQMTIK